MDPLVGRFIGNVKEALANLATDAMQFPKRDPFEHGIQVGAYRGLQLALDNLEALIQDTFNQEHNRD